MKFPRQEIKCGKNVFQIHTPVSGATKNTISIPQVRATMRETQHDTTFETS